MNWGDPFRDTWQRAGSGARATAREAALGPEQAATVLSDAVIHMLQLAQFAAQDLARLRTNAKAATTAVAPGMADLQRAMDDVRHGRVSPEQAERHLLHAVRTAARQSDSPPRADGTAAPDELQRAAVRFDELRNHVASRCALAREGALAAAGESDEKSGSPDCLEFLVRLGNAMGLIERLFLEHKHVEDPAAPLPADSQH
jgi:hypothetical protein